MVNPSGVAVWVAAILRATTSGIAVFTTSGPWKSGTFVPSGSGSVLWTAVKIFSSWLWKSRSTSSASSVEISPRPINASVYKVRVDRFSSINLYISG